MERFTIKFSSFSFTIETEETLILPAYKGSTFRGGFGHAFKRIVCALKNKECFDCLLKEKCIYSYVFETLPPSDTKIMRKYKTAPHPFIIEPPPEKQRIYKNGEEITFGLILIGNAIDYLPYFIYTFDELGKIGIGKGKAKYRLKNVTSNSKKIYDSETKILNSTYPSVLSFEPFILNAENSDSILSLSFQTPTRILYNNHLTIDLEFHIFVRQLLRRISLLYYFHCNGDLSDWNLNRIIENTAGVKVREKNLVWYDWQRYSTRQDTKMKMGGFIGEITFEGNIEPFIPLIKAGEILHVGKGTSFGLGKYKIIPAS
jgi:CRISPR-associated endoribonuclease Cas6